MANTGNSDSTRVHSPLDVFVCLNVEMCEQLNVAAFLWHSWAPRCLLSLCISNSTSAATQRCLIPNLFHFRHSRYPSVFLVCVITLCEKCITLCGNYYVMRSYYVMRRNTPAKHMRCLSQNVGVPVNTHIF